MSDIVTTGGDEFEGWDEERFAAELRAAIALTVAGLKRAAAVWVAMQRRGYDLSRFTEPVFRYLPLIHEGGVTAEAVLAFPGNATRFRKVTEQTAEVQIDLAAGKPIPVVIEVNGQRTVRDIPVKDMSDDQVKQVFAYRHIRTEKEQCNLLDSRPVAPLAPKCVTVGKVGVDRGKRAVYIGDKYAPIDDVIEALAMFGWVEDKRKK
jgi:hypothetical protein